MPATKRPAERGAGAGANGGPADRALERIVRLVQADRAVSAANAATAGQVMRDIILLPYQPVRSP